MKHVRNSLGILSEIAQTVHDRIEKTKKTLPLEEIRGQAESADEASIDVPALFEANKGRAVIAEIKRASPSSGDIALDLDPVDVAGQYINAGATALSVLTEPSYFKGDISFLKNIHRKYSGTPLLMKDFFIDPYQFYQAKANGASLVLIIVALLEKGFAKDMLQLAQSLGLTPLVEIHDEAELSEAIDMGAKFIGVNNRNLKTMKTDLNHSLQLKENIAEDCIAISESGIYTTDDLQLLKDSDYHGYLIGTSFMKSGHPGEALSAILSGLQ